MNTTAVAITNNKEVHPHPPLCGPPSPALGKAYAKRNSIIICIHDEQINLTNGTSRAPSPTAVGEADLSRRESLGEIKSVSFRELLSPILESKRGIHKGENVEGRKNAACLLFCERNLSPLCGALWLLSPLMEKVTEKICSRDKIEMAISSSTAMRSPSGLTRSDVFAENSPRGRKPEVYPLEKATHSGI